jgi:penicillin-binding protein 1C
MKSQENKPEQELTVSVTTKWQRVRWLLILAATIAALLALLAFLALRITPPASDPSPYGEVSRSGEMLDRSGRLLFAFLNPEDQWCFPRTLGQFSPHLINATIAAEDQRFRKHPGVDPIAVLRAALQNVGRRGVASGASTITMQVVKLTELVPAERPRPGLAQRVGTKLWQAWQALRLERALDKDQILEAYLNKAPYGLNLIGAEAAARRYFGKPAAELGAAEAAVLAGLPKAPSAFEPLSHPDRALNRRNYVLDRMFAEGYLDDPAYREARGKPLGAAWNEFPKQAPHLAMKMRGRIRAEGPLQVTLDGPLQASVERMLAAHLKRFDNEVTNAAAIVVDVATASVLARAGSADFFGTPGGGQVDLCTAPRSPGSTLKPFTYALAMERNQLYASEQLLDDTLDYGSYNPANFDGEYHGLVSAETALRFSLNVPAVTALERIGAEKLLDLLRRTGLSTLTKPAGDYGLGLTLGNCEVRLDEMAGAYCMLANLGQYRPLQILASGPGVANSPVLSRGTALAMYRMMETAFPNELGDGLVRAQGVVPRVCWKTGTSTGYRDAWTFAFNCQYVVGVWLGNNDAKSSRRLVGARAALPLAEAIFRSLPPATGSVWPETRGDMQPVRVCSLSGLPATEWCKSTSEASIPSIQYTNRRCDVHAPQTGNEGVVERWPGTAHGWNLARIANPVAVHQEDSAFAKEQKLALQIQEPANTAQYVFTGEPQGDRICLSASLDDHLPLHWYADDRFLGTSAPSRPMFLDLLPGPHQVACMTPSGETDSVTFEVLSPTGETPLRTQ